MFEFFFSVVSEHIDVVMSSEDINADEFLDDITKEWNHLPRITLCANSISQPFRNSSPPPPPRPMTKVDTDILSCSHYTNLKLYRRKRLSHSTRSGSITSVLLPGDLCPLVWIV